MLALYGGLYDGGAPSAAPAGPPRVPQGKRRTATDKEVAQIQASMDQAKQAEAEAREILEEIEVADALKDPRAGGLRNRRAAKLRDVANARRDAIARAVSAYGIQIHRAKTLRYDAEDENGGAFDYDGHAAIGHDAFASSPGWLASTIGHEAEVHGRQRAEKRSQDGEQGRPLDELEAYDWELRHAKHHGLTTKEIGSIRGAKAAYLKKLDPAIRARYQQGNYRLPAGHKEEEDAGEEEE